jgi:glycosyltransferase involved in cell wall biosynthesis
MTLHSGQADFPLPWKRLRIAFVAEAMETGLGQLLHILVTGLVQRGHEVHLIYSAARSDPGILKMLRENPLLRLHAIAMKRAPSPADATAGLAVRRYLRENGPFDVVHGHSSKGGALARLFAAGLPGVRLYTPHAFYTLSPHLKPAARRIYSLIERILGEFCSTVFCSSEVEFRHAEALGIPTERLEILPNAIAPIMLAPPARGHLGAQAGSFLVGFVGRLEYQKAADVLLKAVARASKVNRDIRLVMIGDGGRAAKLKALASELGIAGRVLWLGRQPSSDYLASFDVLAMPSRYEGFSLMPLEAMQAGLPIICTPVGGIAETVIAGVSGVIVPVDDDQALSDALLALAADRAALKAMGAAARTRADMFTPLDFVNSTEHFYFDALKRKSARSVSHFRWRKSRVPSAAKHVP